MCGRSANDRTPDWSRDGRSIVFSSDRLHPDGAAGPRRQNIFVLDVAEGDDDALPQARLLVAHDGQDVHPKWTIDGSTVVFNRLAPPGGSATADVMLADRDGGRVRRVPLPSGLNTYASITPDGRVLVYRGTSQELVDGREVENSDIFTVATDGSGHRRLTSDPAFDGWPAISPDGCLIAFSSRRNGDRFHVYVMPIGGGEPRRLTEGAFHHTQPAWSPDGRSLLVYRWVRDAVAEIGHLVRLDLPDP